MVALAHGRPLVASTGWLTEPLWEESGALVLAPAETPEALGTRAADLLADPARLAALSARAHQLYADRFELRHTLAALAEPAARRGAPPAWPDVQWSAR
jgi:hypothetical protein